MVVQDVDTATLLLEGGEHPIGLGACEVVDVHELGGHRCS